jgi:hypothetical protein
MNSSKTLSGHLADVLVVFVDGIVAMFLWPKKYLGEEEPNNLMGMFY